MKRIILITLTLMTVAGIRNSYSIPAKIQSNTIKLPDYAQLDFKTTLQQTFNNFDSTTDQQKKINLSNRLSMIAMKWNDEWLAHYYLAYSKVILSEDSKQDDAKRDALLDEADKELNKAIALLGKENDETHVLAAFIANWRIDISPMSRYKKYGDVFSEHMKAAKTINPDNPRIYYLEGMAWYGMPKFAGGGKDVALPYLTKANLLYDKETDADIAKPYWGKTKNAYYLNKCKKE